MDYPIAQLKSIRDGEETYQALMFWCQGCEILRPDGTEFVGGLHMLPISGDSTKRPVWSFDGNLESPTLSPSILTKTGHTKNFVCHSFMRAGHMEFLSDCTHKYAGQTLPMKPLPAWTLPERN